MISAKWLVSDTGLDLAVKPAWVILFAVDSVKDKMRNAGADPDDAQLFIRHRPEISSVEFEMRTRAIT